MKREILKYCIILLISFVVVAYKFNQIPHNLAVDEVRLAELALSLNHTPYTAFSPIADGHPTFYFYILLLSFKIFGINSFALRIPAALFSILNPFSVYLILKYFFKKKKILNLSLPFILTLVYITLHWRINFARFSFEASFLFFWVLLSTINLINFLKTKKYVWLFFCGVSTGLVYNCYHPGRFFFFFPLLILFIKRVDLKKIGFFIFPFLLIILPMTFYLIQNPSDDIRVNLLSYYNNSSLSVQKKISIFGKNVIKIIEMYIVRGDSNGRHNYPNKPALNPILSTLFFIGIIIALKKFSNFSNVFFLLFFIISVFPSFLVYPWENPSMLRTYTSILSVIYFIGLSIEYIMTKTLLKNNKFFEIALILLLFISAIYELRTYFVYQVRVFDTAFIMKNSLLSEIKGLVNNDKVKININYHL